MCFRRDVEDGDTVAALEPSHDAETCCRACVHGRHQGCTTGPHCKKHFATDMRIDQWAWVCPDFERDDKVIVLWKKANCFPNRFPENQ